MVRKILFVCLGNICRSPAAEGIFNQKIKERDLEKIQIGIDVETHTLKCGCKKQGKLRKKELYKES